MSEPTISLCLMGKNELNYFLKEVLESALKFVDEIVYVDTSSTDDTCNYLRKNYPNIIIGHKYFKNPQDYTTVKNYAVSLATSDYVLTTDCDEVFTESMLEIKNILKKQPDIEMWSLQGEHFMGDLVHKDRVTGIHIWQNRLYKRLSHIKYQDGTMHGLASGYKSESIINGIVLHHYGFCKNMIDALRRYETNINDPIQQRAMFLKIQFWQMMTGTHPGQAVEYYPVHYYIHELQSHPQEIKDKFHIDEIIKYVTNG